MLKRIEISILTFSGAGATLLHIRRLIHFFNPHESSWCISLFVACKPAVEFAPLHLMERKSKWQRRKSANQNLTQDVAGVVDAQTTVLARVDVTGLPMIYAVDAIQLNRN